MTLPPSFPPPLRLAFEPSSRASRSPRVTDGQGAVFVSVLCGAACLSLVNSRLPSFGFSIRPLSASSGVRRDDHRCVCFAVVFLFWLPPSPPPFSRPALRACCVLCLLRSRRRSAAMHRCSSSFPLKSPTPLPCHDRPCHAWVASSRGGSAGHHRQHEDARCVAARCASRSVPALPPLAWVSGHHAPSIVFCCCRSPVPVVSTVITLVRSFRKALVGPCDCCFRLFDFSYCLPRLTPFFFSRLHLWFILTGFDDSARSF